MAEKIKGWVKLHSGTLQGPTEMGVKWGDKLLERANVSLKDVRDRYKADDPAVKAWFAGPLEPGAITQHKGKDGTYQVQWMLDHEGRPTAYQIQKIWDPYFYGEDKKEPREQWKGKSKAHMANDLINSIFNNAKLLPPELQQYVVSLATLIRLKSGQKTAGFIEGVYQMRKNDISRMFRTFFGDKYDKIKAFEDAVLKQMEETWNREDFPEAEKEPKARVEPAPSPALPPPALPPDIPGPVTPPGTPPVAEAKPPVVLPGPAQHAFERPKPLWSKPIEAPGTIIPAPGTADLVEERPKTPTIAPPRLKVTPRRVA